MDGALSALRALVVGGRLGDANLEGSKVNIGGQKFAKDEPTAWKASLGAQKGNYYSLEAILFALQHAESSVGEYLKKARDAKLGNTFVSRVFCKT
jgi:hypothetical protein